MAKYPFTELGFVAKNFKDKHCATYSSFIKLAEAVSEATGVDIKEMSFQQMRRDDRGYPVQRKAIMDFMRERDPALVEVSLAAYSEMYCRKEA